MDENSNHQNIFSLKIQTLISNWLTQKVIFDMKFQIHMNFSRQNQDDIFMHFKPDEEFIKFQGVKQLKVIIILWRFSKKMVAIS